jgi:hypothetical protein
VDAELYDLNVQNQLAGDLDAGGNSVTNLAAVGADSQNSQSITWVTPGDDLQSRFDAAPAGGLVAFEVGVHDVGNMGTATVEKPVDVWMPGSFTGRFTSGAFLINTGTDTVDSPVITFQSSNVGSFSDRPRFLNHKINVVSEAATSPALRYDEYEGVRLQPHIKGNSSLQDGVELLNGSFLFMLVQPGIIECKRYGYYEHGTGGSYGWIGGTINGDTAGARIENPHYGFGAQFTGQGPYGIDIRANQSRLYGPRIEGPSTPIRFGDPPSNTTAEQNKVYNIHCSSNSDVCVDFADSSDNLVKHPARMTNGSSTGTAVRFQADSQQDVLAATFRTIAGIDIDGGNGEFDPTVQFDPTPQTNDGQRGNINDPRQGMVVYNSDDGNLNIYDGSGWILPDGTSA